jgi:hypothetical protein
MRSTRKVVFPKQHGMVKARQKHPHATDHLPSAKASTMVATGAALYTVPLAFSTPPPIKDSLVTATSSTQDKNIQENLPLITATAGSTKHPFEYNEYGVPRLDRLQHIDFLKSGLEDLPASFVSLDASRPWMVYWGLVGLYLLGEDVTQYRTRLVPLALLQFHLGRLTPPQVHSQIACSCLVQCRQDGHRNAKRYRRIWWRTWAVCTPGRLVCGHT